MTEESKTLRSRFGLVATVLVWAVCAATLVSMGVYGYWLQLLRFGPLVLLAAFLMWLLFWSPSVTIGLAGVEVRNLLRRHDISWPAVEGVETKYALTIETTAGKVTAWAAPAPSRFAGLRAAGQARPVGPEFGAHGGSVVRPDAMLKDDSARIRSRDLRGLPESTFGPGGSIRPSDIPTSDSGLAALYVRRYWEELRDAGYLDSGRVEGTGVRTHWLRGEAAVLAALAAITVLCLALVR
ncbi:PH domain-containing protein [Gryllotalpicola ginsengisoli]|uniref:PH domain-containing protein n=1 Tax=Gryllotalpicola ginsengisoli TaxID=444608 RepID=UPI0003B4B600|nr:PH domain-containing protein [Gryllotalpicola ginsengisoli]